MSATTVLFLALAVLVIAIGMKTHLNYGVLGIAAAFLMGIFYLGLSSSSVIALFPITVLFNLMNATMFYGFASENGTYEKLAGYLVYRFQGVKRFMPLVIFVIASIVSGLGAGAVSTCVIVTPIAFAVQRKLGFKPIMASLPVFFGAYAFDLVPWGMDYAWFTSWAAEYVDAAAAYNFGNIYCGYSITIYIIITLLFFIFFRGWEITGDTDGEQFEKPEPMTGKQKLSLVMILAVAGLLIIPAVIETFAPNALTGWISAKLSLMPLCAFGTVILALAGAANFRDVISKRIPWDLILMTCGMGMFFSLAIEAGIVDEFSAMLSNVSSPALIVLAVALTGGVLSCFLSGTIVAPVFFNLAAPLSQACGLPISSLLCAGFMGMDATSFSPFSQGGAVQISFCPDEKERARLANIQLAVAFSTLAMVAVFAVTVKFGIGAVY